MKRVAVIDIGSNTVKILVAAQDPSTDGVVPLFERTEETRLSAGISPIGVLHQRSMRAVYQAVQRLAQEAVPFRPDQTLAVATSVVREAPNRNEFLVLIQKCCGIAPLVISGETEALLVARGVSTDPSLRGQKSFNIADLGGGSLECVRTEDGVPARAESFPLGAVRLTHLFVRDLRQPSPENFWQTVHTHALDLLKNFPFANSVLVGTGGAFNVTRAVLHPDENLRQSGELSLKEIEAFYQQLAPLGIDARCKRFPALSPARADIMPAALAVIAAAMQAARVKTTLHTLRNLRYGVADALLNEIPIIAG